MGMATPASVAIVTRVVLLVLISLRPDPESVHGAGVPGVMAPLGVTVPGFDSPEARRATEALCRRVGGERREGVRELHDRREPLVPILFQAANDDRGELQRHVRTTTGDGR